MHINAQGYVEPCPFAHFAANNIKEETLEEIFRSRFLRQIRSSNAVFRRGRVGCALLENLDALKDIAAKNDARPTDTPDT